jgi:hypothetical protein
MLISMLLGLLMMVLPGLVVGALPFLLPRRWPGFARLLVWGSGTGVLLFLGDLPAVGVAVAVPLLGGAWRPRPASAP